MLIVDIDFETRSRSPISAGASHYSLHAEIMCLSYSINAGPVKSWAPGEPDPTDLFEAIEAGALVYAHNAVFEQAIWANIMVAFYMWPEIKLHQWRCTMTECYALGLPGSLEKAAEALELDVSKDMAGRRLMLKLSKPRKPTKTNAAEWHEKPEEIARLRQYCDQDVLSQIALRKATRPLIEREQKVYQFDNIMNQRGIGIDIELAKAAVQLWDKHLKDLNAEIQDITFGAIETPSQVAAIVELLPGIGCIGVHSLAKADVDDALKRDDLPATARRILEIRSEAASSSIKKYHKMIECVEPDGRVRGCFQYHGAGQTGRWAGRLIQPQNFPRGVLGEKQAHLIEPWVELVKSLPSKAELEKETGYPIAAVLSTLARPAIVPAKGKRFLVCDFSSVEARGLAWAAGEKWLLQAFIDKRDPYIEMATDIYGVGYDQVTKDQRFYGKQAVLGCFDANTLVLTDSGIIPIAEVTKEHKLFDGIEWVEHEGLIEQGVKEVITYAGITATADHEFLLSTYGAHDFWMPWYCFVPQDSEPYKAETFDILNSGPRHRFTVIDNRGFRWIAHNCGYQMGGSKFQILLETYGVNAEIEFCNAVISAYRKKNKNIVSYWYETEKAAVKAVKTGGAHKAGPFIFHLRDNWLHARMPCGRDISYYKPTPAPGMYGEQIRFIGTDISGKPARQSTYGGKLVENLIQSVCRDLLVEAMSRLERAGYEVVMQVHDEVVAEVPEGFGSVEEMQQIMSEVPSWAEGFPIGAEGFEAYRYRK